MASRIYRSSTNKVIAGVCGGLGEYFDIDPTLIRLIAVVAALAGAGMPILIYLLGWIIMPQRFPGDPEVENVAQMQPTSRTSDSNLRTYLPGLILVGLGVIFLMREYFYWFSFGDVWPLLLVGIGLYLILRHRKSGPDDEMANDQPLNHPPQENKKGDSFQ